MDPDKLAFFSSPHKGLEWTVRVFDAPRRANPRFRLFVANPGYYQAHCLRGLSGVVDLGCLAHREALRHVREALAVLLLNHTYPETFGLVLAEANAVGVPVLTHSLGAAPEVLDDPAQFVDARDVGSVVTKLMSWRAGCRPVVQGRECFRLKNVILESIRCLGTTVPREAKTGKVPPT